MLHNSTITFFSLIQAGLGCLPVHDYSLSQDLMKIFRVGQRISKCQLNIIEVCFRHLIELRNNSVFAGLSSVFLPVIR